MASNFESSIHRGSDLFFDYSCYTCKGNDRNTEAEVYCEDCSKVYCGKCLEYHNFLYQKHVTLGKKNIGKWPVYDATFDVLEQCQAHKDRKLDIFCEDHRELMCTVCHVYNHKKCSHVVLLGDKVKDLRQKGEFKQLSVTLDALYGQLILKKDDFQEKLKSLEKSYNTIHEEIKALRRAINDSLDQLERKTIKELDTLLAKLRSSIQTDNGNCNESIKKMTSVKEDWLSIKGKTEAIQMIMYRKCLDLSVKTKDSLQEMTVKNDIKLSFTPDPITQQTMSTILGLGKILIQENTITRETKPEVCCTFSSNEDPEIQAGDSKKPGLVSRPVSKKPRQAEISNQTSALNKPDMISNQTSVTPKQDGTENQSTAVNKQYHVSDPISSSSTQSNNTRDLNKPGRMSDTVTISSHQLVHGYQSSAIGKSDPNQVIRVKTCKKYNVQMKRDNKSCSISGICETDTRQLLIADWSNNKMKLLDQNYKVVAHCDLPSTPWSMCNIDSSLVAVAMRTCEVHFIKVTNGQLVQDRLLNLQHNCWGITHHKGNLYILTNTALYHYTVDGRLVSKLYEDTQGEFTEWRTIEKKKSRLNTTVSAFAISPDGDRIYLVINRTSEQLVTLSRDGRVISTLTDPVLEAYYCGPVPHGLHITDSGQVLVCGAYTIIQVDRDGRQKLAEVPVMDTEKRTVTVRWPTSVYYSKHKGILVVGMWDNDYILVFSTH